MSKIIEYLELKQLHKKILNRLRDFIHDYKYIRFLEFEDPPMIQIAPTICAGEEATKHLYKLIADILRTPAINRIIHEQINQILTEELEKARLEAQKEIKEILGEEIKA